jgi:tetratricopeptide (TPR) repeat protein
MEDRWLELADVFEQTDIRPTIANQRRMEELIEITQEFLDQGVYQTKGFDLKDYMVKFLVDRGRMSSDRGDRGHAKDWYLKALEHKHPSTEAKYHWVRALVNWGVVLYKEGQREKATEIWEKICQDFKKFDHPELQDGLLKTHINLFYGKKQKLNLAKLPAFVKQFIDLPYPECRLTLVGFILGYSWPFQPSDPLIPLILFLATGRAGLIRGHSFEPKAYEEAYSYFDLSRRKQLLKSSHISSDHGLLKKMLYTSPKPLLRFEEEALFGQEQKEAGLPEVLATDPAEERPSSVQTLFADGLHWYALHTEGEVNGSDSDKALALEEALQNHPFPRRYIGKRTPILGVDGKNQWFLIQQGLKVQSLSWENPGRGLEQEKNPQLLMAELPSEKAQKLPGKEGYAVFDSRYGLARWDKGQLLKIILSPQNRIGQITAMTASKESILLGTQTGEVYRMEVKSNAMSNEPKINKIIAVSHQGKVSSLQAGMGWWLSFGEDKTLYFGKEGQKSQKLQFSHPIEDAQITPAGPMILTNQGLYFAHNPEKNLIPGIQGGISLWPHSRGICLGDRKGRVHFLTGETLEDYQGYRIGHGDWPMVFLDLGKERLLSGSLNGSILEWNSKTMRVLSSHCPSPAHHLGYWRARTWFTVGENYLLFWEDTWEPKGIFSGKGSLITMVKASPKGGALAVGEENGSLHLLGEPDQIREVFSFDSAILSLCWRDEKNLVVGLWNGELGIITLGRGYRKIGQKEGPILSLLAGGRRIYAGDNQGFICAMDEGGRQLWNSEAMGEAITSLCLHPEGKYIYAGGGKGSLLILETEQGLLLGEWQEKGKTVWSVESQGNILLVRARGPGGHALAVTRLWQAPFPQGTSAECGILCSHAPGETGC